MTLNMVGKMKSKLNKSEKKFLRIFKIASRAVIEEDRKLLEELAKH